jgi:signal transduction histidine kinase
MLYVGSLEELTDDQILVLHSLAEAFSTAYARYEDFKSLEAANKEVEKGLVELRLTQQQLVQSEKMASLGELTAGIAHEIQNPLNFVNNFSDLNKELVEELKAAVQRGDHSEAMDLIKCLGENEGKINMHGKRVDGIVKSMLQHSKGGAGLRVETDVNKLVEEYVRLAWKNYRSKHSEFALKLSMDFAPMQDKVRMVAQDIGKVLMNLLDNAFYALHEKLRTSGSEFVAEVIVRTKVIRSAESGQAPLPLGEPSDATELLQPGSVIIEVEDNGPGIAQDIAEKIYQPFFTTKPTGEGTGLGLSLAYDIVTKGHGGKLIYCKSNLGGAKFTVDIPSR